MNLKPIETGCLAIIIRSTAGNEGTVVTIGKFLGHVEGYAANNRWEIDKWIPSNKNKLINHVRENWMLRIDGEDFAKEDEEILEKER